MALKADITIDIDKQVGNLQNLTNIYNARVGDNNTPLTVLWQKNGIALNLKGLHAFIAGKVGDGSYNSETDKVDFPVGTAVVKYEDDGSGTLDNGQSGLTTLLIPKQMWSKTGLFAGYIGLKDENGSVFTSKDIFFKVLGNVLDAGVAINYFIGDFDEALAKAEKKLEDKSANFDQTTTQALRDLHDKYLVKAQKAEDTLGDTQAAIDANLASFKQLATSVGALQAQIEADNLETRPEHIADITLLKQQIDHGISEITPYPETYADLSAVQRQYPTGTNKLIVTDDGHRAVYRDGSWKDGGVFQVTGIADNSITANKLTNRTKTPWSSWENPVIVDFKNNVLTVPSGVHLLQGKRLYEGDTYIISEADKVKLAKKLQSATTDEEKKAIKNFKPSYPGIFVSFAPTAVSASTQFKFYDLSSDIPESEYYVGWINFAPANNFRFIFRAINADNEYATPNSLKSDFFKNTNIPRNDDYIYTQAAWNFDFDNFTITMPSGATVHYKQDTFQIAPGTYPIADANNKSQFLYIYCDISNDYQIKIVSSTNQNEQTNTHVLIGYADIAARIFHIKNLTTSTYVKPKCRFINVYNEKITVDFDKKVIHFPNYQHVTIDSNDSPMPAFDLPLADEDVSDPSEAQAYFVVVDPSANYSKDRTKCFKMYNYLDNFINGYVKVLGWVEPNSKTYDFGSLGSSFEEQKNRSIYPWANKKITCLGDSITQGDNGYGKLIDSYVPKLEKWLQTMPTNAGICGSKITYAENEAPASFVKRVSTIKNQDVVTIFGGVNDFLFGSPLGTMSDASDKITTFYGALKYIIITLATNNPDAKLMLITPMKTSKYTKTFDENGNLIRNSVGSTELDYVNAIKDVGNYYSIPVLDMYSKSNFNPYLPNQLGDNRFTADGLHPTAFGYERIAQQIAKAINNL